MEPEFNSRKRGYARTAKPNAPPMSIGRRPIRSDSAASGRMRTSATRLATVMDTKDIVLVKPSVLMKYVGR